MIDDHDLGTIDDDHDAVRQWLMQEGEDRRQWGQDGTRLKRWTPEAYSLTWSTAHCKTPSTNVEIRSPDPGNASPIARTVLAAAREIDPKAIHLGYPTASGFVTIICYRP